jgi:hypothetical protein
MAKVVGFTRRRKTTIAGDIATVIRLAFLAGDIACLFGLEGPLRASLRADLCLRGWRWIDADQAARDIMAGAHRIAGAERPDWQEGQPEWVIREGVLIERTRCIKCHKPLPEENYKFCSRLCGDAHQHRMAELRKGSEDTILTIAIKNVA